MRRLTDGDGVDLVVDPVGGTTLAGSLAALRPHGRLVFVGNAGGGGLAVDLWPAMMANVSLTGVFMGSEFEGEPVRSAVADLLAQAARGEIEVVVDRRFGLAEAAQAHRYIAEDQVFGRVLLIPE